MTSRTSRMKALAKFVYHKFIACLFMFPIAAPMFSNMVISTLQMRKKLQKFLDSIIGKSGKCRALIRDIRQDFSQNPEMQRPKTHTHQSFDYNLYANAWLQTVAEYTTPCWPTRQVKQMESLLTKLDSEHDRCSQIMAKGELNGFPPEFPDPIIIKIDFTWHQSIVTLTSFSQLSWMKIQLSSCTHLFLHEVC